MEVRRTVTKLDSYDIMLLPGSMRVTLDSMSDPVALDILSELEEGNGVIFYDGLTYSYLDNYMMHNDINNNEHYLELYVVPNQ